PVAGVTLLDQFENGTADVQKRRSLCAPANKNGEGIHDAVTHQLAYQIRPTVPHQARVGIQVTDQFGTLTVDTRKTDRVLVPSGKTLGGPAAPPAPGMADHYKCYTVKVAPGTSKFPKGIQATVADQFQTRLYDVRKP